MNNGMCTRLTASPIPVTVDAFFLCRATRFCSAGLFLGRPAGPSCNLLCQTRIILACLHVAVGLHSRGHALEPQPDLEHCNCALRLPGGKSSGASEPPCRQDAGTFQRC